MTKLPWFLTHDNPEHIYTTGRFVVVDFETDSENHGSALHEPNDLVLACWQIVEADGTVSKTGEIFGGIYEMQELLDDIASVDFIVAHNAKFELQWLRRCGLELRDVLVYDTLLAAWVMDGNQRKPRSLAALAKRYSIKGKMDMVSALIRLGVPVRWIHSGWLLEYCHQDVNITRQVFLQQLIELKERKQFHLVHVRNLTCSVLADIEFEGLFLDEGRVREEYAKAAQSKDELGAQLAELTGGINLKSPKQLSTFLYDTLQIEPVKVKGKEVRSANSKILEQIKPKTEKQKAFFALYKTYNKAVSLLSKNLEYFKLTCEQKACKFYGEIKQNVVKTHRLASGGFAILFDGQKKTKSVQLQNIPREFKRLFRSPNEDEVVMEADSAQVEFRVAVDMGDDEVGRAEVEGGTDIHSFTAQVLYENGDPEMVSLPAEKRRQEAKKSTFRPLYGGGSGSPALVAYCEYFKEKYEGISGTQREWALRCVDKGQFTTPYGMTFYFPGTTMNRNGYISNTTSIYNFPIQGFATGEIIPIALVHYWHRSRDYRIRIFLTVHDSIIAYVHKDDVKAASEIAQQSLTTDVYSFLERVYDYKFRTPLGFGIKVAKHWGDSKEEVKLDVFPDGTIVER